MKFINDRKGRFGVTPICRVLSEHGCVIAPSTRLLRGPPPRAVGANPRDEQLIGRIEQVP